MLYLGKCKFRVFFIFPLSLSRFLFTPSLFSFLFLYTHVYAFRKERTGLAKAFSSIRPVEIFKISILNECLYTIQVNHLFVIFHFDSASLYFQY